MFKMGKLFLSWAKPIPVSTLLHLLARPNRTGERREREKINRRSFFLFSGEMTLKGKMEYCKFKSTNGLQEVVLYIWG